MSLYLRATVSMAVLGVLVSICTQGVYADQELKGRAAAARAIESVYWQERTWPAANTTKPPLDSVIPNQHWVDVALDQRLQFHEMQQRWKIELTPEMIQAELDRFTSDTLNPSTLRALFAALGDDPERVGRYLVAPLIVDRLLRTRYAGDREIHSATRAVAERDLARVGISGSIRSATGSTEFKTWDVSSGDADSISRWNAEVRTLASDLGVDLDTRGEPSTQDRPLALPHAALGRVSSLLENEHEFYAMQIRSISPNRIEADVAHWPKRSFSDWWNERRLQLASEVQPGVGLDSLELSLLTLPAVPDATCSPDRWEYMHGFYETFYPNEVWTGNEVISLTAIRGGVASKYQPSTDRWSPVPVGSGSPPSAPNGGVVWTGTEVFTWKAGGGWRFQPISGSWTPVSTLGAPPFGPGGQMVWTGTEVLIWTGDMAGTPVVGCAKYKPSTDSWSTCSTLGAPTPDFDRPAVWTGTDLIVWGGSNLTARSDGARYNLATDQWFPISSVNAPSARTRHSLVWTGSRAIVWGGEIANDASNPDPYTEFGDGRAYDPVTDTWTTLSSSGGPISRARHAAVWTGTQMLIWGGSYRNSRVFGPVILADGRRYDPLTDSWSSMSDVGAPSPQDNQLAIWTGKEMILTVSLAGRYNPTTDSWLPVRRYLPLNPTSSRPEAVWTGSEMIAWGEGISHRFRPALNDWFPMTTVDQPVNRVSHTAVWDGTRMIIWGGIQLPAPGGYVSTGGRYDPTLDRWQPTSLSGAPSARSAHTSVWTGTQMIVWGGLANNGSVLNDGARYNSSTDTWQPMASSTSGAFRHTAVWTGTEMIVWGGSRTSLLNTGGHYNPTGNSWSTTGTAGQLPAARQNHTAVWSGTRMIVWGGEDANFALNSGGLYNPTTKSWTSTSLTNAPQARTNQLAVWSGTQMVIWGGDTYLPNRTPLDTGGWYDPAGNAWTPTTTLGWWPGRGRAAVWTGNSFLMYGGMFCTTCTQTYFRDLDVDDHGAAANSQQFCWYPGAGWTTTADDCNDADAGAFALPQEVSGLKFDTRTQFRWNTAATNAGAGTTHDAIRGSVTTLPVGGSSESCIGSGVAAATLSDTVDPSVGGANYYLIRGHNSCGAGTWGRTSAGVLRSSTACP